MSISQISLYNYFMKSNKIINKTFIKTKLLQYTREFSEEEIKQWQKEDTLPKMLIQKLEKYP